MHCRVIAEQSLTVINEEIASFNIASCGGLPQRHSVTFKLRLGVCDAGNVIELHAAVCVKASYQDGLAGSKKLQAHNAAAR